MTTQEVATRLYELRKSADYQTAHNELFADDATSTEKDMKGGIEKVQGREALRKKEERFESMVEEMYGGYCHEPRVFGDNIFMEMGMDVKMKGMDRMQMDEMCHYKVSGGKIISEEFFY